MAEPTRDQILKLLTANEKWPHREHQVEGVYQLVTDTDPSRGRIIPRVFFLADEVGAGKSKQCVDASQILYLDRKVNTVVVVTPGFARSTWADADALLGEVAKHAWDAVPNVIHEYHKNYTELQLDPMALNWVITNFEFIRREDRLHDLMQQLRGRRVWLILDESWALSGFSDQMRACRRLRNRRADRVTLLNGTPLSDGAPEDTFYPMSILDPQILGLSSRSQFMAKHCIMGGYDNRKVVQYQHLDDYNQRMAPYVLSRRTRDCFDLPPMLPPVTVEARLTPTTWSLYTSQRDDMVTWLGTQASVSKQAIVKGLRLAQLTSGFLGGLEDVLLEGDGWTPPPDITEPLPQFLRALHPETVPATPSAPLGALVSEGTREIGREKLDAFIHWLETFHNQPEKLLVWSRFKPELERTTQALRAIYPEVYQLRGGQTKDERHAAKTFLAPGGNRRRGAVVGNQKAGGASLNFAGANIAVYLSNGLGLLERTQSIGRIERPGATQPMLIVDVVAVGPKGQKTIDHAILRALRSKDDMARWTVDQWRKILRET